MINKKTLLRWRQDSLIQLEEIISGSTRIIDKVGFTKDLNERILILTQELIDHQLLKGKKLMP